MPKSALKAQRTASQPRLALNWADEAESDGREADPDFIRRDAQAGRWRQSSGIGSVQFRNDDKAYSHDVSSPVIAVIPHEPVGSGKEEVEVTDYYIRQWQSQAASEASDTTVQ